EFSFVTKRPALFINTPIKVVNPEYDQYENKPIEIAYRDICGISIDPDEVGNIADHVSEVFARENDYRQTIINYFEENVYNIGSSGQNGAKYIISSLKNRR
ncbi:MAG: hypothetical protein IKP86_05700, partial [Anaerolineaceae bacterium]|nr:hypothetical protein [Anaerolineaceae bacterium]